MNVIFRLPKIVGDRAEEGRAYCNLGSTLITVLEITKKP